MPRDLPIGNGNVFIAFDQSGLLREFSFPYVGTENHVQGNVFRFGVWIDGHFSWVPDGWKIQRDYLDDTLVTVIEWVNEAHQLKIIVNDCVDFHANLYLKKVTVENVSDQKRDVRLFFAHDFQIHGNSIGDTAEYRPDVQAVLHYKADRYFLINLLCYGKYGIEEFSIGNQCDQEQGSFKDAEDGVLNGHANAQGSVDSTIGVRLELSAKQTESFFYWIACGTDWDEVKSLNDLVKRKEPGELFTRTQNYWKLWVNKDPLNETLLTPKVLRLYKRSLLIARTHMSQCGSIIAGMDSDVVHFNRDTYSYMWPRDAALIAHGFDLAGYSSTIHFYELCAKIIEDEGYFLHKYNPSGSRASSWHPWLKDHAPQLPIQEDETALVIWALWEHYQIFRDIEWMRPLYRDLIRRGADFMMNYRDLETSLPLPSYDLWEERQGILTFTVSAVYGGLSAAAHFAEAFGDIELAKAYREGAEKMRDAMDQHLYLPEEKRFARMIFQKPDGSWEVDRSIDASLYGIFAFGPYSPKDEKVVSTMEQIEKALWHPGGKGGVLRYANDPYYRTDPQDVGNPWIVTTLWLVQYDIAKAKTLDELALAMQRMEWVTDCALPSGVLPEQVDPRDLSPTSVSPLTWSHGTYILVVHKYLNKLLELETCTTCQRPKISKFR